MVRYFIELSFRGTGYHGWQAQPNAPSVQAEIERVLGILTHSNIGITGAGRTDTGVHARYYVAHFDTEMEIMTHVQNFIYQMNALLPTDIAVQNIRPVQTEAHARYSAVSRTYQYTIGKVKSPFDQDFAWQYTVPLNVAIMNEAAEILLKQTDFTSFCKLHSDVKNNICHIYEAEWIEKPEQLIFIIRGNRFLRNMVRALVGTMIDLGRNRLEIDDLYRILEGKNRSLAGFSVPAQGLALTDIQYPPNIWL
jgi:tRNA pseudouridine38-40 synthase